MVYPAKLFHREISPYHILTLYLDFILGFSGVTDLAETDFDDFRSDYLGYYETMCETAFARESTKYQQDSNFSRANVK
jgi:hypothetical protein